MSEHSAKQRASKILFGDPMWLDRPDMADQMDDEFVEDNGSRTRRVTPNQLIAELNEGGARTGGGAQGAGDGGMYGEYTPVTVRGSSTPISEGEGEKPRAYDLAVASRLAWREEAEKLARLLVRCRTVLGNMAEENEGAIFNRWPISHEPLRADARGLVPLLDEALSSHHKTFMASLKEGGVAYDLAQISSTDRAKEI